MKYKNMEAIKSYTSMEQSKVLAEILPIESADMFYRDNGIDVKLMWEHNAQKVTNPCWSLAALLDVLESEINGEEGETYILNIEKEGPWWNVWYRELYDEADPIEVDSTEYLVDACYEMILKLNELKML